jgi:hypothetical protein
MHIHRAPHFNSGMAGILKNAVVYQPGLSLNRPYASPVQTTMDKSPEETW